MTRHKGETWSPNRRNLPNTELGIYCKHCYTTHAYKSHKTLGIKFERNNAGLWVMLWFCKKTGNVIKEQGLMRS
jgi:hypothetical protein